MRPHPPITSTISAKKPRKTVNSSVISRGETGSVGAHAIHSRNRKRRRNRDKRGLPRLVRQPPGDVTGQCRQWFTAWRDVLDGRKASNNVIFLKLPEITQINRSATASRTIRKPSNISSRVTNAGASR